MQTSTASCFQVSEPLLRRDTQRRHGTYFLLELWVRTLRLLEEDETAKSSRTDQSKITILATR